MIPPIEEFDDTFVRDISDLLLLERRRHAKNVRFTARTRGKSPAGRFRQEQVRDAILHCVVGAVRNGH